MVPIFTFLHIPRIIFSYNYPKDIWVILTNDYFGENMKNILIGIILGSSFSVFAESYSFKCENSNKEKLSFNISTDTKTIVFSNIDYFGNAQIIKDTPFGATINDKMNTVEFSYDWYYSADYKLVFTEKPFYYYTKNEIADLELSFDDSDGASVDKEKFSCSRNY